MKRSLVTASILLVLLPVLVIAQTADDRLIAAAQNGDTDLARELLAKGADVNAKT